MVHDSGAPDPNHLLYKIKRSMKDGARKASVIPVANICQSAHLFLDFGPVAPCHWTSATVLETCGAFFVNSTYVCNMDLIAIYSVIVPRLQARYKVCRCRTTRMRCSHAPSFAARPPKHITPPPSIQTQQLSNIHLFLALPFARSTSE